GQIKVRTEVFLRTGGTGEVEASINDVLPGGGGGSEALLVAGDAVPLEHAIDAGEHLVSFGIADLVDALPADKARDDVRAEGALPGADDEFTEGFVFRIARDAIEQHHRF